MNEKYAAVLQALPDWQPSRENRVFGITAIKQIASVTFPEAVAIKKRLHAEGWIVEGQPVQGMEQLTLF